MDSVLHWVVTNWIQVIIVVVLLINLVNKKGGKLSLSLKDGFTYESFQTAVEKISDAIRKDIAELRVDLTETNKQVKTNREHLDNFNEKIMRDYERLNRQEDTIREMDKSLLAIQIQNAQVSGNDEMLLDLLYTYDQKGHNGMVHKYFAKEIKRMKEEKK